MKSSEQLEKKKAFVFAYYVTGHGFGHATRVVEVVKHIIAAGHEVYVVTGAPGFVFRSSIADTEKLHVRKVLLDCGAVQSDALTVDRFASLEKYRQTAVIPRASILAREVEWLQHVKIDLVLSDIVPVACRAAAEAGIPSVCITNFSWDFIYADYVMAAGHQYRSIVWQIAEDYSHAQFLLRLPGYCPMPAFRDTIDVPLVVRKPLRSKEEVRNELGINEGEKLLLFNFGGQDANWSLEEEFLPRGWKCLVCAAPTGQTLPSNFKAVASDAYTPDLIAASDCMLGKIGYGTTSEALAFKVPFVFVRRDYFNEEPFLRNMLEYHHCGVEMIRRDFLTGCWSPYLAKALKTVPSYDGPLNGGEVVARIVEETASGNNLAFQKKSGAGRLQDAIVFGFQMQRIPGQELGIPKWYTHAEKEFTLRSASSLECITSSLSEKSLKPEVGDFEVLYGDGYNLLDTTAFLKSLSSLADMTDEKRITMSEAPFSREWLAAAGLFDWKEDIYVSRAPGRLDVMGGIGDYSGSLVLQMPIGEACHVAVQLSHPGKQHLWKHAMARKGSDLGPVIQIVSLGAELCNRAPTFDMDIEDFLDAQGKPITYEAARAFFGRDPSQKWAAYVAGTILVLMREKGVKFQDGISILVSSAVPEGKGVSSSAAVEVATMSALIAAYGLNISPTETAVLCQKVENHVVGAPCGVMDQMASACGEAYKLLAMVCQPAEVKEHVNIPTHIRFWGIDSGIRHSVGGTDYGSVRVGTFMGRTIIKATAAKLASSATQTNLPENDTPLKEHFSLNLLQDEGQEDYLCNLSTYRYESIYAKALPEKIKGEDFISTYGSHRDEVTSIKPFCFYPVKAPTAHAVYDNFRSKAFAVLLEAAATSEQLQMLGELMYQSHNSYSNCGLGSAGTDLLVQLVQQSQNSSLSSGQNRLFGAKITGGGCGGTVCIMGWNCRQTAVEIYKIQELYKDSTGHLPFIFEGSSPGAGKFGYLRIRRKEDSF
ncbi:hypothetical protein GOP47_0022841 [Adiantum capillus-veneris]|uniref:L-arabinokinase n=1 Tax=Adiantum capillus-veneris TaxID=13818 RepID=A0A9D4Z6D3_ADICA|nr:hypothetical protein GOP47_0022841 [Adiantum capillus-veneris]